MRNKKTRRAWKTETKKIIHGKERQTDGWKVQLETRGEQLLTASPSSSLAFVQKHTSKRESPAASEERKIMDLKESF